MLKRDRLILGYLCCMWSAMACATESFVAAPLENLLATTVTSAAKRPQKIADAPAMVRVVTAEEIRVFGWRTLAEALNSLPGIHTSYDRSYVTLGLRGFGRPGDYNSRLLMLIDGVPFNDGVYDQAAVGTDFPLDIDLIERIEYVPGPSSSLYGGNAFLGVVNIVTATGRQTGNTIAAGIGSLGRRGLRATWGGLDENGNDYLLALSRMQQDGRDLFFPSYATPGANAWSRNLDYDDNDRFMARYARGGLLASLIANQRDKGAPGGPYGADLNDRRNSNLEQSLLLNVSYEHFFDTGYKLNLHGYALGYEYEGRWAYAGTLWRDFLVNRVLGGEARLTKELSPEHTLVAGTSWRLDAHRRQHNAVLDVDMPRRSLGLFVQDDWRPLEWLVLSAGGRFDRVETNKAFHRFSPRLAVIAAATESTRLKLIAGSAFRPPNGFETEYAFPGTNLANPGLKPEHVDSIELGVEHRPANRTELSANLYRNHIDHLITLETNAAGLQQHRNVGSVVARGLELSAGMPWATLQWRGSLSWQAVQHENGEPLANTPRHMAKLLATRPLTAGIRLAGELHYLGPRRTESGNILTRGRAIGGYTLVHATLSGGEREGFSWQLHLANLFDRRYSNVIGAEFGTNDTGATTSAMSTMRQDGRTLWSSLRWAF